METTKLFHIKKVQDELTRRMESNPQYSLRSFARDLSVTPSWLSDFINCKKGLSEKRAVSLVDELDLNENERELFLLSVSMAHSRSPKKRSMAQNQLRKAQVAKKTIGGQDEEILRQWYHYAILELLEVEGVQHSGKWFAQRLQIPVQLIEKAIADLEKMGWLKIINKRIVATYAESQSTIDTPSQPIKKYHDQLLTRAKEALVHQPVQDREFTNMTLAFNTKNLAKAKRFIRDMQAEFARQFYTTDGKKDSVYQLSVQLFRLDKK